jgi:UDPglucose--hexose-1-phosphate uridylyltransferase
MAKYVPDIGSERWVIIAPGRVKRPDQSKSDAVHPEALVKGCPFCAGNEHMTPPEVYRYGPGEKDQTGWDVRVVPNLYPITDTHEVIIHSTNHTQDVEDLPVEQVAKILMVYRDRYRAHENDGQVLIFCNHGLAAGASLAHPHSQLVVVPKQINLDTIAREPVANVVTDNTYFVTYCPDFSQWPFEVWIAPKRTDVGKFSDIPQEQLTDLAGLLQETIRRIRTAHGKHVVKPLYPDSDFVYNYYIYYGTNWYLRIIPRFVHRAGFELGTGLNVNIIDPTRAAEILKES